MPSCISSMTASINSRPVATVAKAVPSLSERNESPTHQPELPGSQRFSYFENPAEERKLPGNGVERDKEESRSTLLAQHLFARRSLVLRSLILLEMLLEARLAPRFKLGQLIFL